MKKILLPFIILLALTLAACGDDGDKNSFKDTTWTTTAYLEGYTTKLVFSDFSCSISSASDLLPDIRLGANYVYTHSGNTASLTSLDNYEVVIFTAVISESTLILTDKASGATFAFTKE